MPQSAEDVPTEAVALKTELTQMLPFAPIVSLLIELDKRTRFLDCFTHAEGRQTRTPEVKRNLLFADRVGAPPEAYAEVRRIATHRPATRRPTRRRCRA